MSGTNRLVLSNNVMKSESEQKLVKDLENANEVAIADDK